MRRVLRLALLGVMLASLQWTAAALPCSSYDLRVLDCFNSAPACGWCVNTTMGGTCRNTSAGCYNYSTRIYENQMAWDVLSPADTLLYNFPSNGVAGALLHWQVIFMSTRKAPMRVPRADFGYFWDPQQSTGSSVHELEVTLDCSKDLVQLQVSPLVLDNSTVDIGGFDVYARVLRAGKVNVSVTIDGCMVEGLRVAGMAGEPWPMSLSPNRAPAFLRARFGREGRDIEIDFDVFTDSAGLVGHFECFKLLNTTTAELGLGSYCVWETARRLTIKLGSGFSYRPGSVLAFVNGSAIRSLDSLSLGCSNCTSFAVLPPILPCALSVRLEGPIMVNNLFSELVVDSRGSFLGPLESATFNWTLVSVDPPNPGSSASVAAFLEKQNGSKLIVPLSSGSVTWASDALYVVRLEVSNGVLSVSGVAQHNVTFREFNSSFAERAVLPLVQPCDGRSSLTTTGEQPVVLCISAELTQETRDAFVAPSTFPQPEIPAGAPAPIAGSFSGTFRRLGLSFNWTVDAPFDANFSGYFDVDPAGASGALSWLKTRRAAQFFLPAGVLQSHGETYSFSCEVGVVTFATGRYNYSVGTGGANETNVYEFDFEVPLANQVNSVSAAMVVGVIAPPYAVVLEGGGSVPADSEIVLSAVGRDPISVAGNWVYDWKCSVLRVRSGELVPCVDKRSGKVLNVSALVENSTVTFATGTLDSAPCCLEFQYVFEVRARKLGDSRGFSESAQAFVYYASPGLPIPSIGVTPSVLVSFSPTDPLVLVGNCKGSCESVSYHWTVAHGDLSLSSTDSFFLSPRGASSFALKPNVLMCGRRYVFRLTADSGGLLGVADAVVDVAACPVSTSSNVYLEWSPSPAIAYLTRGRLSAGGWLGAADGGEPERLLYRFGFYDRYPAALPVGAVESLGHRSANDQVHLSDFSLQSEFETFLPYPATGPVGALPGERRLRVFVDVCGLRSLACGFASIDVGVVENSTLDVPEYLVGQLQLLESVGATQLVLATGIVFGEYVKSHWDPAMLSAFDYFFGVLQQACGQFDAEFVDFWPSSARLQMLGQLLPRVEAVTGVSAAVASLEVLLAPPARGREFLPESLAPRGQLFEAVLGGLSRAARTSAGATVESLSNRLTSVLDSFFFRQMEALPCGSDAVVLNSSTFEMGGSKIAGPQLSGAFVSGPRGFSMRFPPVLNVASSCLVVRATYYASSLNPHGWAAFERQILDSPLVSVEVNGSFNSSHPFELVVPFAGTAVSDRLQRLCLYWDPSGLTYDESVCSVVSYGDGGTTTCLCEHLSDYAGFDRAVEPPGAYLDDPRGSDFPSVVVVLLAAFGVFAALILVGCCLCAVSGSSAFAHVVAFAVSFILKRLKRLRKKSKGEPDKDDSGTIEDEKDFVTLSRDVRSAERTVLGSDTMSKEAQRRARAASRMTKEEKARKKKRKELEELESRGTDIESMTNVSRTGSSRTSDDGSDRGSSVAGSLRGTATLWKDGPAADSASDLA